MKNFKNTFAAAIMTVAALTTATTSASAGDNELAALGAFLGGFVQGYEEARNQQHYGGQQVIILQAPQKGYGHKVRKHRRGVRKTNRFCQTIWVSRFLRNGHRVTEPRRVCNNL